MVCFGYEAKGDDTQDGCYYCFESNGKPTRLTWTDPCGNHKSRGLFNSGHASFLFPVIPQLCDVERMKVRGEHWQWDSDIPMYNWSLAEKGPERQRRESKISHLLNHGTLIDDQ